MTSTTTHVTTFRSTGNTTLTSAPPKEKAEVTIRSATAEDRRNILDLIKASYGRHADAGTLASWDWKHKTNPFGISPCLVAESGGQLVGVRLFLPWSWRNGPRTVHTARAVDTATHPAWQGRGIFSRLTMRLVEQLQRDGVTFIYNTPNRNSMPGYLKMGWVPVTTIPLWIRPLRLFSLVRGTFSNGPIRPPQLDRFEAAELVLSDPDLTAFLSDPRLDDDRYHTARTTRYLRWRYAENPCVSYKARFERIGSEGALVIARLRIRGQRREITLSELIVTPSSPGIRIAREVMADLVRAADADYVAACAARRTTERDVLVRSGFLPAPRTGPYFTVRRLSHSGLDPAQWTNWRCSIGDLELF